VPLIFYRPACVITAWDCPTVRPILLSLPETLHESCVSRCILLHFTFHYTTAINLYPRYIDIVFYNDYPLPCRLICQWDQAYANNCFLCNLIPHKVQHVCTQKRSWSYDSTRGRRFQYWWRRGRPCLYLLLTLATELSNCHHSGQYIYIYIYIYRLILVVSSFCFYSSAASASRCTAHASAQAQQIIVLVSFSFIFANRFSTIVLHECSRVFSFPVRWPEGACRLCTEPKTTQFTALVIHRSRMRYRPTLKTWTGIANN